MDEGTTLTRDALLARLRINFHYGSGETEANTEFEQGQDQGPDRLSPIAALPLHTDRGVFDKRSGGFTSKQEVAAALLHFQPSSQTQKEETSPVVTSLSYAEFEQLYVGLVAGGEGAE